MRLIQKLSELSFNEVNPTGLVYPGNVFARKDEHPGRIFISVEVCNNFASYIALLPHHLDTQELHLVSRCSMIEQAGCTFAVLKDLGFHPIGQLPPSSMYPNSQKAIKVQ
jgi:hypothetical protein